MGEVRVEIAGVGNSASSLVQGIAHYANGGANDPVGLMYWDLGGYRPKDLRVVASWDVDTRKVQHDVADAIFAKPNSTARFAHAVPPTGTLLEMGAALDGIAPHMEDWPEDRRFVVADAQQSTLGEVMDCLRARAADVLVKYLPVGS